MHSDVGTATPAQRSRRAGRSSATVVSTRSLESGGVQLGLGLGAGNLTDGEAKAPHDESMTRPRGTAPGELILGEVDDPFRLK